jgi:periplasmic divalent cation tolerance protein
VENDSPLCLVLTTWPADRDVDAFAQGLVTARLAACVHVLPAGASTYRWQGAVESAREHQVIVKTTRAALAALEAQVRAAHPYELPEWLVVEVTAGEAYGDWLRDSVASAGGG